MVIYNHAIFVAAASDRGLHCLLKLQEVKGWMKQS